MLTKDMELFIQINNLMSLFYSSSRSRNNSVSMDLERTRPEDKTYQDSDSGTIGAAIAATANNNKRKKYSSRVHQTSLNSRYILTILYIILYMLILYAKWNL